MATFEKTIKELTKLKAVTRPRSQDGIDLQVQLATMAGLLADIEPNALEKGCADWAAANQWFPTVAELRSACIIYQSKAETKSCTTYLPPPREIPERERARNAWGYRQVRRLMSESASPESWDKVRVDIDRMRQKDSAP